MDTVHHSYVCENCKVNYLVTYRQRHYFCGFVIVIGMLNIAVVYHLVYFHLYTSINRVFFGKSLWNSFCTK